ncbi:MAG TPA: hypothetical protein VF702_11005 [Allosphingosinicella sp.]|jgi:hypothetical protein
MTRLRRIAAGALALFAAVQPAAAAAQDRDCALLRAMTARDGSALRTLRFSYEPGTGISFFLGRNRADLPAANECEFDTDAHDPNFECRWRFGTYAEAVAFYEPFLARARQCLGVEFTAGPASTAASAWSVIRTNAAEITEVAEGEEFDENAVRVEVELIESSHPELVRYYVTFGVEH